MIEANVICDSVGEFSPRLTTFKLRYHRFIHAEVMTHRMLSRNASSSRAVPVKKLIEEVSDDATRAAPVWWGAEQKGMQSGDQLDGITKKRRQLTFDCVMHLTDLEYAQGQWDGAALDVADRAKKMAASGVHKSIVNRILEPYSHINVITTGVEDAWLNFFGLRLDKAAQPEMRALAELMWAAWNESTPRKLTPGQWHLPFVRGRNDAEAEAMMDQLLPPGNPYGLTPHDQMIRVSVARCARVSYESFETGKRSTVEEDLKLYERLLGAQPLHASPAEHQATPDVYNPYPNILDNDNWENPSQHGNLPGWIQFRKTLKGERVAPLPEGYVYQRRV